jgi:hypothetical protein
MVMTDKYDIYAKLPEWGYGHKTVCHSKHEFARDEDGDGFCEVHVNTIEGYWSLLRSWLLSQMLSESVVWRSRVECWRGAPKEPVSSTRHLKRSGRFSRTPLSSKFLRKGYVAYRTGAAFGW